MWMYSDCPGGKALVQLFELQAKLAAFLQKTENEFFLKRVDDALTDYSELNIWQIYYQK